MAWGFEAEEEEAAFQSGDTMMSPMPPAPRSAKDFEFDAALLSGDTVMSPSPNEAMTPLSEQPLSTELMAESEPIALGAGDEIEILDDDAIPLSDDDMLGGEPMDLESSLMSNPSPPAASPPAAPIAAVAANGPIVLPMPIHLGQASPGMLVERVLRVPLQYTDATGHHETTLEVTLRFKLS